MSAPASRPKGLAQLADDLLAFARQEAREGFKRQHPIQIRDAAEKGWNAAVQATDLAMRARGQMPTPGPQGHQDRHEFLEKVGRHDLHKQFAFFADRLHGACFYGGLLPHEEDMNRWLDEVQQYIEDIKAGI
ncbi:MAG TPA: hypothetical protein VJ547_10915 [Candidatus Thermoplasmatota archaeon]|nr:hypothetical protein [Candidatus Thermoplasmatota archaeon]